MMNVKFDNNNFKIQIEIGSYAIINTRGILNGFEETKIFF